MLYRVRLDLAFATEEIPRDIWARAEAMLTRVVKIANKDNPMGEPSFIEIHKCYHDEDPAKPCEIITRIEV